MGDDVGRDERSRSSLGSAILLIDDTSHNCGVSSAISIEEDESEPEMLRQGTTCGNLEESQRADCAPWFYDMLPGRDLVEIIVIGDLWAVIGMVATCMNPA